MGVTLLILGIALVVTVATVKEYMKQRDYEEAKKIEKDTEAFREEERILEAQIAEELAKIPAPVIIETPPQEPVVAPKPKKKYYHKKTAAKSKKSTK